MNYFCRHALYINELCISSCIKKPQFQAKCIVTASPFPVRDVIIDVNKKLLTLYKAASDPTYLKRGGGGIRPDLSSRPVVPRETQ